MPMNIKVRPAGSDGLLIIEPDCVFDDRGFFMESYRRDKFRENGIDIDFVQDNHSRSRKGVMRGMHYQNEKGPQYRLVRCTVGEVFDVAVDLRVGSPTFGKWFGVKLTSENRHQLLIPPAFAHGFATLSDVAEVQYKVSGHHNPAAEACLAWDDPDVAIEWPVRDPILSEKDRHHGRRLKDYLRAPAFRYA